MKSSELRESFLKYFEKNKHTRVASSSLVPENDPTLFFVNAGMVQFKDIFLGNEKREYTRAVTSQKCMRVSGKHNDLENVGHTPRHHTFFEMLGNFSFGDYFKEEAIAFGWNYLTKELKLPRERLYVTVFREDDEAEKLWTKHVEKSRIFRLGGKDNFWSMGDVGPCGPCSEIHYDRDPGSGVGKKDLESNRFMEVWNLVFMQFNKDSSGKMTKLSNPSIDTGMGLERLAAIMQGVKGNYETDLFMPVLTKLEEISQRGYKADYNIKAHDDMSMRVIADHIRSMVFLIADGVLPSNEGRGYVLRRIIRRAARHGRLLRIEKPFFVPLANIIIDDMGSIYPELVRHRAFIEEVIANEEKRFAQTLDKGLEILEKTFTELKKSKIRVLSGEDVFTLYDTYGFPKDLTKDIAEEAGFIIDEVGFARAMEKQREMARSAWRGSGEESVGKVYKELNKLEVTSEFIGYDNLNVEGEILAIIKDGRTVKGAKEGERVGVIFNKTPFYGESGGQVGDMGVAVSEGVEFEVLDTKKPLPSILVHEGALKRGNIKVGETLTLAVDEERREGIKRNHTATHILHKALREILGEHVKQSGSLVTPERLRFDFSHFSGLKRGEIADIEAYANRMIRLDLPVVIEELTYENALKRGALAFFGDKYGNSVRVVSAGDVSIELCGGTHVCRTGEIGMFKIVGESSVAAGVRRIEALTGEGVEDYIKRLDCERESAAAILKVSPEEVVVRIEKLLNENKKLAKDLEKARANLVSGKSADIWSEVEEINGVKFLSKHISGADPKELRSHADALRSKLGSGVVMLAVETDSKTSFLIAVTSDLTKRFAAGSLMKEVATAIGGTGGGRPDMAQGGVPEVGVFEDAKRKLLELLKK